MREQSGARAASVPVCVTLPGYKPLNGKLRRSLAAAGIELDPLLSCART
jgi:hypothetical protein